MFQRPGALGDVEAATGSHHWVKFVSFLDGFGTTAWLNALLVSKMSMTSAVILHQELDYQ